MKKVPLEIKTKLAQCKAKVQQLQTCYQVTSLLNSELNFSALLDTIMAIAKQVVKADASSLLLMDKENRNLAFKVALGNVGEQIKTLHRLKVGEGIAGSVAQTGKALIIKDAYKNAKFNPQFDKQTGFKTGSILCSPLTFKGEILGVCQVIHHRDKKKVFSGHDLALFKLFCDAFKTAEFGEPLFRNQAPAERVAHDLRPLHDFLQHKMFVPPLLRLFRAPIYLGRFALYLRRIKFEDAVLFRRDDCNFPVLQKDHFARMREDGRRVRCDEVFALSQTQNDG